MSDSATSCDGRRRCIDLADGDAHLRKLHFRISVVNRVHDARVLPGIAWATMDGKPTYSAALEMARLADSFSYATTVAYVYFPGLPDGVLRLPTIGRCRRSRTRCGLPNDPVMTWPWPSPG